jgi:predicted  nucleic acid-binding Zn-ribbon protein
MLKISSIYEFVIILVNTTANVLFEAFFVMGLVYVVNSNTGLYKNVADLTSEFNDFRKILWKNCYETIDKEKVEDKIKKLEEEIDNLKHKMSKLKKLHLASNDVIEKISERIADIEDELDENFEENMDNSDDSDGGFEKNIKKEKNK